MEKRVFHKPASWQKNKRTMKDAKINNFTLINVKMANFCISKGRCFYFAK